MSWTIYWSIECNTCGSRVEFPGNNRPILRIGWKENAESEHMCPLCSSEREICRFSGNFQ